MKLTFITPPSEYLKNPFRGDQHAQMQLLTILQDRYNGGLELSLEDMRGVKKEFVSYRIPEADVYLQSIYTVDYEDQIEMIKSIKERYPKAKHIAGGPHATLFPDSCSSLFDSVVLGDAEETLVKVVQDFQSNSLKKVYCQEKPVDINSYPYANRSFLPKATTARKGMMSVHHKKEYDDLLGTTVVFTRGCPYKCAFCAIPQIRSINPRIRYRSPDNIVSEIEYLKRDYEIQGINLLDEIGIPLDKKMAVSRLEALASTGIIWRGQCRVDGITTEIASKMKESGCVAMALGVESAWQPSLDIINKKINVEKSKETIKLLKDKDIAVRMYMMLGLPGEPKDIVDRTWDFIQETKPDVVFLSFFTIRPGTDVYNHPDRYGIKYIDTDWKKNNHLFDSTRTPTVSFEYHENAPWGRAPNKEEIVGNYIDLSKRIENAGLSPVST